MPYCWQELVQLQTYQFLCKILKTYCDTQEWKGWRVCLIFTYAVPYRILPFFYSIWLEVMDSTVVCTGMCALVEFCFPQVNSKTFKYHVQIFVSYLSIYPFLIFMFKYSRRIGQRIRKRRLQIGLMTTPMKTIPGMNPFICGRTIFT